MTTDSRTNEYLLGDNVALRFGNLFQFVDCDINSVLAEVVGAATDIAWVSIEISL